MNMEDKNKNTKRKRYTWSEQMHSNFMSVIFELGMRKAKPKTIFENMKPVPESLSIFNIKANLQKYRSNKKRTIKLFTHQMQIAQNQALKRHHGKVMNPGFHAYPLPIGNSPFPIDLFLKSPQYADKRRRSRSLASSTSGVDDYEDEGDDFGYYGEDIDDCESPRSGVHSGDDKERNVVYMSHQEFEKIKSSGQGMWVWHGPSAPKSPPPKAPPPDPSESYNAIKTTTSTKLQERYPVS
mmetsp:Transcript_13578/g.15908  ORF Transcript_13578/g.15908 Transcript_13578/m.15908 type:complete len:239 (-) Transcript_13578:78-794(-)